MGLNSYNHIKNSFDEIFELYDGIQDDFRATFHSLQKNTFIDYIDDYDSEN